MIFHIILFNSEESHSDSDQNVNKFITCVALRCKEGERGHGLLSEGYGGRV